MTDSNVLFVVIPIAIIIIALIAFFRDKCITAFVDIGKSYPYNGQKFSSQVYYFSAKMAENDYTLYSGGLISATEYGLFIKHPLIFRIFMRTSLIPWRYVTTDNKHATPVSLTLTINAKFNMRLFCRPRAIKEIKTRVSEYTEPNASSSV